MASPLLFLRSDDRLIDMIRTGDDEALVQLYRENRRMVVSYVLKNNGSGDDADDLLQEAVVILWERVRTGRFDRTAKLSTFLYATVRNLWRRRLAAKRREVPAEPADDPPDEGAASPLDDMIDSERSRQIASALGRIGEPCRTLLILFYWEELPMEEIATRMHFANADTVKSKKYQCKKALQQLLNDERND
jgi:RNA polymerase sigma factor (sigma-70 family)